VPQLATRVYLARNCRRSRPPLRVPYANISAEPATLSCSPNLTRTAKWRERR